MTWGEQNTEAEGHAQMDYALERGVNFIDTAEMYSVPGNPKTQGSTESIIGTWLAKNNNRDQVVLASKITGPLRFFEHIRKNLNFSKEALNDALTKSLKRSTNRLFRLVPIALARTWSKCFWSKRLYS